MQKTTSLALILAGAALLSACSTPVKVNETPVNNHPLAAMPAKADARDVHTVVAGSVDPLADANGVLAKRSVYFDYDRYTVRADGQQVVANHAGYLTKNKGRKILIQGNTDERGGTEYNLALGQKRAEAVRKALHTLGVDDSQMEAVSLGETKPKASGSTDAAWAENRRADIVY